MSEGPVVEMHALSTESSMKPEQKKEPPLIPVSDFILMKGHSDNPIIRLCVMFQAEIFIEALTGRFEQNYWSHDTVVTSISGDHNPKKTYLLQNVFMCLHGKMTLYRLQSTSGMNAGAFTRILKYQSQISMNQYQITQKKIDLSFKI